jgi:hypothetical protein
MLGILGWCMNEVVAGFSPMLSLDADCSVDYIEFELFRRRADSSWACRFCNAWPILRITLLYVPLSGVLSLRFLMLELGLTMMPILVLFWFLIPCQQSTFDVTFNDGRYLVDICVDSCDGFDEELLRGVILTFVPLEVPTYESFWDGMYERLFLLCVGFAKVVKCEDFISLRALLILENESYETFLWWW